MRDRIFVLNLCLLMGCSSSDDNQSQIAPPPGIDPEAGAAPVDSGAADSGTPATVAVSRGIVLPGFPHSIDAYVPSTARRAVVFLHGGGGTKEGAAVREIGIATGDGTPVADEAWLLQNQTAFLLPQGRALATAPKATTWSNHVMTSGADDVAFLGALADAVRAGSVVPGLRALDDVYLAGHSNGGMMANRMWCETSAFTAYAAISGPASVALKDCHPATPRPFLTIIGGDDTILQTKGAWSAPTWSINSCLQLGSGDAFVDPSLVNDEAFFAGVRIPALCNEPAPAPTTAGPRTIWTACGGKARLERIDGADHCVVAGPMVCRDNKIAGGSCDNSLEAASGLPMRDVLVAFFAAAP